MSDTQTNTTVAAATQVKLPRVAITYCTQCRWMLRAGYVSADFFGIFFFFYVLMLRLHRIVWWLEGDVNGTTGVGLPSIECGSLHCISSLLPLSLFGGMLI
ncbi:hypothetical protein IWX46DRAFT_14984 [Phyllosticta citricarpa]|uniref:Uncharacterized protein n=1 Tax=Phyllosticta citricarpa TaxID=55181 RepID=A0ABR1MRZ4_9PEZI